MDDLQAQPDERRAGYRQLTIQRVNGRTGVRKRHKRPASQRRLMAIFQLTKLLFHPGAGSLLRDDGQLHNVGDFLCIASMYDFCHM